MSSPFLAAIGLTASMICACGPGVTPILMVSARTGLTTAAITAEARRRRRDMFVSFLCKSVKSGVSAALVEPARHRLAEGLDALHQRDQDDDDACHHIRHEALIAVADAEVAQPAAADGAHHRRIADQTDQ